MTSPDSLKQINALHATLAQTIGAWTEGIENLQSPIPGLSFFRREANAAPCACLIEPSIVLVVQGEKKMWLGDESYTYNTRHFLITSLDLPANSEVVDASQEKPCLGLVLKLDFRIMADLIAQGGLTPPANGTIDTGMGIGAITLPILEPFKRLLEQLDDPHDIAVLAPLIQREIHYRLLVSDQAPRLWQIAAAGSQTHRITKAVDWLKTNYAVPLRIEELADRVQMSTSSLHHHFRKLTAMSPLQYQKSLRLNEARRLMLNENIDAATSAYRVGYESPSQFSREYSRLFGASPRRDVDEMRRAAA
ncbi:MAG: AraC family transcriptional regulator [Sideroxydans sp.]|nr:AraC family transcriptional regulator [Sideroxydans sp.]